MIQEYAGDPGPNRWRAAGRTLSPRNDGWLDRDEPGAPAPAAYPPPLEGLVGTRWLRLAAEMAGLTSGNWRPASDFASIGSVRLPRVALRTLGADVGSVRAARDFAVATLHRWGTTERSQDIAIVVSELLTNALRHALPGSAPPESAPPGSAPPGSGASRPGRPIRFGLLQPGSCVLCAVADPSRAVPVLQAQGAFAETGRGLPIICALSDQWGYASSDTGKVVWAMFRSRLAARRSAGGGSGPRDDSGAALPAVLLGSDACGTGLKALGQDHPAYHRPLYRGGCIRIGPPPNLRTPLTFRIRNV